MFALSILVILMLPAGPFLVTEVSRIVVQPCLDTSAFKGRVYQIYCKGSRGNIHVFPIIIKKKL